ncbi:MAG TPA: TIGR03668 family PPOX class F420-dependent oxidoreductase [Jatrophihabitantaceae bacterium]|nr:TIGR03668 family PPOX class F420-dependent oxidoreductase [Jatrophihabitantaceae bacterium]
MPTTRTGAGAPDGIDRDRVANSRVGRLATVRADCVPHLVVITFALADDVLVTAVDAKPKSTTDLQRLRNLRADPAFSLLVDKYDDDDWSQLWWVRLDGSAEVVEDEPRRTTLVQPLVAKYPQYLDEAPAGPVIVLRPARWSAWAARDQP